MLGFPVCTFQYLLPTTQPKASALSIIDLSGLSPSLICFGSSVSLSTLRPCRYLQTRKTRYMVRLVPLPRRDFHPQDRRRLSWRPGCAHRMMSLDRIQDGTNFINFILLHIREVSNVKAVEMHMINFRKLLIIVAFHDSL